MASYGITLPMTFATLRSTAASSAYKYSNLGRPDINLSSSSKLGLGPESKISNVLCIASSASKPKIQPLTWPTNRYLPKIEAPRIEPPHRAPAIT